MQPCGRRADQGGDHNGSGEEQGVGAGVVCGGGQHESGRQAAVGRRK